MNHRLALAALCATAACAASPPRVVVPERRLGDAMDEAGRRFQRAGKAVLAGRWELAGYDLHEMEEIFDEDLAKSSWHGKDKLPELAQRFRRDHLTALRSAITARDRAAFEHAASAAARACNECHRTADQAYIEISEQLGTEVPDMRISPSPR